jgi:putative ABC transport system permease protein
VKTQADASFSHVGNEVVVEPAEGTDRETLTRRQVVTIDRVTQGTVVPVRRHYARVATGGGRAGQRGPGAGGAADADAEADREFVSVYGIRRPARVYEARTGRVRSPLQSGVLVGSVAAERYDLEPGGTVVLDNRSYRVHAVLANYTSGSYSNLRVRDGFVVPPRAVSVDGYHEVTVVTANRSVTNATAQRIRRTMNGRVDRVEVTGPDAYEDDVAEFYRTLNLALLGIASISLTVAGVSILNVMLMSTVERRQEIGVLRAVGFRRRHVLQVILVEAATLGAIGGGIGVVVSGLAGLVIFDFVLDDPTAILLPRSLYYVGLGFGFAALTGILSGAYPAWKAANEHPVDALRS